MTTIKVTVDSPNSARRLTKLLKTMTFVKSIEEDIPQPQQRKQFAKLKNIFTSIEPDSIFHKIKDPVDWQKSIRDEWETH